MKKALLEKNGRKNEVGRKQAQVKQDIKELQFCKVPLIRP